MDILKYIEGQGNKEYKTGILNTLRLQKSAQKTNIAKASDIPWGSAANLIDDMTKYNFIIEGLEQSNSDKRKTLVINPKIGYFIGVSVGTSHVKVALLDFSLNNASKEFILSETKKHGCEEDLINIMDKIAINNHEPMALWCANTPSADEIGSTESLLKLKTLLNNICDFALKLDSYGLNIFSICFSFPGHVDFLNNSIIESSNFDFCFKNVGIINLFTSNILESLIKQNIRVYLEHNVKSAAVAEVESVYDKNFSENMAIIYFGTGLGASFILDSKLYRGSSNASGQLGHTHFGDNSSISKCACGRVGCLEQVIREGVFNGIDIKKSTGKELANYLDKNNERKKQLVHYLSETIYNLVMILEIDTVVFSGKLSAIYKVLENEFQEQMISKNISKLKIIPSAIGDYASAIGSAKCGYYRIFDIPFEWNKAIANTKADI
ncbi:MAG: ROK family protein [Firmicutes bacterium]|nr:ROK family protein [Bacillota bacterium]